MLIRTILCKFAQICGSIVDRGPVVPYFILIKWQMIDKTSIENIITDFIGDSDLFLVDLKISHSNNIEVFIDADSRVNIDDCISLSKTIEASLDREVEDFELNVSSAGLDMPLRLPRQYRKYIGQDLSVLSKGGIKYNATLASCTEDSICLKYEQMELLEGKKRKQAVGKEIVLPYNDIKTTFVIISFK